MKLMYFAWVRQKVGIDHESVELPDNVTDVGGVIDWLRSRGPRFADALKDASQVRVAVNHQFADSDAPVNDQDEVAIFPPVTGG